MQRSLKRANLDVERLESRDVPAAGRVSVILDANDNLIVRGDNQNNQVRIISQFVSLNQTRVIARGLNGTKVVDEDGNARREFSLGIVTLTGMDAKLRGGNDLLQVLGSSNPFVDNSVFIDCGTGHDRVAILDCQVGNNLRVVGGDGNDKVILNTVEAFGVTLLGDSGNDRFDLIQVDTRPEGKIDVRGHGGNDLVIFNVALGKNANNTLADGGSGDNTFVLRNQNKSTVSISNFQHVFIQ